jgi:hypothetical protein
MHVGPLLPGHPAPSQHDSKRDGCSYQPSDEAPDARDRLTADPNGRNTKERRDAANQKKAAQQNGYSHDVSLRFM